MTEFVFKFVRENVFDYPKPLDFQLVVAVSDCEANARYLVTRACAKRYSDSIARHRYRLHCVEPIGGKQ